MTALLIDTNILIDYLRERAPAVTFVEGLKDAPTASVLTVAELYAGVRDGRERRHLDALVNEMIAIPVDRDLATSGGLIRRRYARSHGVGMVDAVIAATAERHGLRLATLNAKHFPQLTDVLVPY